ncbi:MAG: hypothetical protein GY724_00985 [Actinomycetia bacterium]|nr:hypothetical protein [Actinomycetes bacterium]MCP4957914.1 hypothetical protein [Actinomycetes bacterium]
MLIDQALPDFDATIIEHIVIDAPPSIVYEAARDMDFLQVHSPMLDAAMFLRSLPGRIGHTLSHRAPPPPPPTMRLADLLDNSADQGALEGWLALGEVPGQELVFGAIGKVWQPDIEWKTVSPDGFPDFHEPDYAKIAVGFSIRGYGTDRSLLSYEARTAGTTATARRKFLRYWRVVRPFVHVVMRAAVVTVKDLAEQGTAPPPSHTVDPLHDTTGQSSPGLGPGTS